MTSDAGPSAVDRPVSPLVNRWTALDRGWQALVLGVSIVVAHLVIQFAVASL